MLYHTFDIKTGSTILKCCLKQELMETLDFDISKQIIQTHVRPAKARALLSPYW